MTEMRRRGGTRRQQHSTSWIQCIYTRPVSATAHAPASLPLPLYTLLYIRARAHTESTGDMSGDSCERGRGCSSSGGSGSMSGAVRCLLFYCARLPRRIGIVPRLVYIRTHTFILLAPRGMLVVHFLRECRGFWGSRDFLSFSRNARGLCIGNGLVVFEAKRYRVPMNERLKFIASFFFIGTMVVGRLVHFPRDLRSDTSCCWRDEFLIVQFKFSFGDCVAFILEGWWCSASWVELSLVFTLKRL